MIRTIVVANFLVMMWLYPSTAFAASAPDDCRIAAAEAGPARRALLRRRAGRASRSGRAAQSVPVEAPETVVDTPPKPAVLEASPPATWQVPQHETEVWPQAAALFPAE